MSYSQDLDVSDLGLLLRAASVPDIDQVQTRASVIDHYEAGFNGEWGGWDYEFTAYRSESDLGTATVESPPARAQGLSYTGCNTMGLGRSANLGLRYAF